MVVTIVTGVTGVEFIPLEAEGVTRYRRGGDEAIA